VTTTVADDALVSDPRASDTWTRWVRRPLHLAAGTPGGKVGLCVLAVAFVIVVFGPSLASHGITDVIDRPYAGPASSHPLGTDYLGRDVLSRFLYGGRLLVAESLTATLAAFVIGGFVGLLAGIRRGRFDALAVWIVDVLLSVPALILALLILAGFGAGAWTTLAALTIVLLPGSLRIARSATLDAASTEYVEAALVRGESTFSIAVREVLPNIRSVLAADIGMRIAYAAMLYAGLSFLGLGAAPPAADWGLMVSENRGGLLVQPLAVLVPSIAIALFTVSVTGIADSIARTTGRTS
jgi:ABC-type dipeptide/oligopeptide/nickel transport system permease subunit